MLICLLSSRSHKTLEWARQENCSHKIPLQRSAFQSLRPGADSCPLSQRGRFLTVLSSSPAETLAEARLQRVGHDCMTENTQAGAGRASPAHTCPKPWRREFSGVLLSSGRLCSSGAQRCVQTSPPASPSSWWPPLLPYSIPWQGWAQRAWQLRPGYLFSPHPPGSAAPCPGPLLPYSLMEGKMTLEENAPCPPHPGWL